MIVTTTPTIMDGQVLRWYTNEIAEEAHRPLLSASRNGVQVHAEHLHQVEHLLDDARRAHERLARGEDVTDMATHHTRMFRPIEPIQRPAPAPAEETSADV